jgi:hypothetical protein
MKTCSYCGQHCADDAVSCSGCGTEFVEPPSEDSGGPFHRPPRPEAKSVVLRTFSQEAPAQRALATLRAANIEGFIGTDDGGGLLPPLTAGQPFWLVVSEVHKEAAEQILDEFENSTATLVEQPPSLKPTEPAKPR